MIFKYIKIKNLSFYKSCWFSNHKNSSNKSNKQQKKKPPLNQKGKQIQIQKMNFNVIPQQYRKGVKGNIQAQRLMTTVYSQLSQKALAIVIKQQRKKLQQTLNSYGINNIVEQTHQNKSLKQEQQKKNQKFYDVLKPLKIFALNSSSIAALNILLFSILKFDQNYSYLGYFLGASLSPSIIFINGIAIGFNCAIWILHQSLHLHLNEVTQRNVNLVKSNKWKIIQMGSIVIQLMGLGYYLLNPDIFCNYYFIALSSILSQIHLINSLASFSRGKFQFFKKLALLNLISSLSLICLLLYFAIYFRNSLQEKNNSILNQEEIKLKTNKQSIKNGYNNFMQFFKQKDAIVVAGAKINQQIL